MDNPWILYGILIVLMCIAYFETTLNIILKNKEEGLSFLNPLRNYKKWKKFNWFGVGFLSLLLNVVFLPYSIFYWIYRLFYWFFTVGRKPE